MYKSSGGSDGSGGANKSTRRLEDVQFACLNPKQIARTRNATLLRRELTLISIKRPRDLIRRPAHRSLHRDYTETNALLYILGSYNNMIYDRLIMTHMARA